MTTSWVGQDEFKYIFYQTSNYLLQQLTWGHHVILVYSKKFQSSYFKEEFLVNIILFHLPTNYKKLPVWGIICVRHYRVKQLYIFPSFKGNFFIFLSCVLFYLMLLLPLFAPYNIERTIKLAFPLSFQLQPQISNFSMILWSLKTPSNYSEEQQCQHSSVLFRYQIKQFHSVYLNLPWCLICSSMFFISCSRQDPDYENTGSCQQHN